MSRQCSVCGQVEALMMFEVTSCRHGHTWMADKRSEVLAPHELEAHHLSDHLFPACDGSCYEKLGHECKFCKQAADQAADDRVLEQGY